MQVVHTLLDSQSTRNQIKALLLDTVVNLDSSFNKAPYLSTKYKIDCAKLDLGLTLVSLL